jgi:membrane protein YdbS with pleckstrin-like domain
MTRGQRSMMEDMPMMMWGMGLVWLLVAIVAVLVIAALIKYVFFR